MGIEFQYDVIIEESGQGVRVNWGSEPGWLETHKDLMARADRLTLVPKPGVTNLPPVSIQLGEGRRWVLFSRVIGTISQGEDPRPGGRAYAIGWQKTVGGKNVKSLTWVYPNGMVENAEEPTWLHHFR